MGRGVFLPNKHGTIIALLMDNEHNGDSNYANCNDNEKYDDTVIIIKTAIHFTVG
jgi:hypothetical protein